MPWRRSSTPWPSPSARSPPGCARREDLFAVYGENQRLREENQRLLQWQEVARRLETENSELKGLLHFEPQDVHGYITARVIANSGGAFLRNVLVDVGAREGVERGQAAIAGEGIVGRVAEVGNRAARVLLRHRPQLAHSRRAGSVPRPRGARRR